jgi:hypothetical protein
LQRRDAIDDLRYISIQPKLIAMKKLLPYLLSATFLSCQNSQEIIIYKNRIAELEMRVDSLKAILELQSPNVLSAMSNGFTSAKSVTKKKKKNTARKSTSSASFVSSKPSYTGYCHGTTKKGYPCSRRVTSGLYCWQHGG